MGLQRKGWRHLRIANLLQFTPHLRFQFPLLPMPYPKIQLIKAIPSIIFVQIIIFCTCITKHISTIYIRYCYSISCFQVSSFMSDTCTPVFQSVTVTTIKVLIASAIPPLTSNIITILINFFTIICIKVLLDFNNRIQYSSHLISNQAATKL